RCVGLEPLPKHSPSLAPAPWARLGGVQQQQWTAEAPNGFLNTATVGLPPRAGIEALLAHVTAWQDGRLDPRSVDVDVDRCRAAFGRLVGVPGKDVAIASTVSSFTGLVAAALPSGARVLVAEGDFTSILFPFLEQERRDVQVRVVALDQLIDAIDATT